jgi:hypothetical protein
VRRSRALGRAAAIAVTEKGRERRQEKVGKRERRAAAAALRVGHRRRHAGGEQLLQLPSSSFQPPRARESDGKGRKWARVSGLTGVLVLFWRNAWTAIRSPSDGQIQRRWRQQATGRTRAGPQEKRQIISAAQGAGGL